MATMLKTGRLTRTAYLTLLFAIVCAVGAAVRAQSNAITITLTGQSMIRSDIRATAPAEVPVIQALLKGDVIFTNLESAVAEKGETIQEGRGFLTPPEALDALKTFGVNLLALSGNHPFDLKVTGIRNTIREADKRNIVHAGTGNNSGGRSGACAALDMQGSADSHGVRSSMPSRSAKGPRKSKTERFQALIKAPGIGRKRNHYR